MKGQEVLFSRNSDEWETPSELFANLNHDFNFTLDPCASEANHLCEKYYTAQEDGLAQSWEGETVFINPPYSKAAKWVEKSYIEAVVNGTTVVMLLPARTDTKWFHNFIYDSPHVAIRFLQGRLKFKINGQPIINKKGQVQSAPFPSMVVIFKREINAYKSQL